MSKIEKFMAEKKLPLKAKKQPAKNGKRLNNSQIIELCRQMLKDFGYIE